MVSANDDAMQEVQYINGQLVGALDTSVNVAGDAGARAGLAWFVVKPSVRGGVVSSATHVARQGYIAQQGEYLLFPHINMTQNGAMAVVFGTRRPGHLPVRRVRAAASGCRLRIRASRRSRCGAVPRVRGDRVLRRGGALG